MGMADAGAGRARVETDVGPATAEAGESVHDQGSRPVEKLALLVVAQPDVWSAADADRLDDLLHRTGGHLVELEPTPRGPAGALVDMVFDSVEEALTAAAALHRAALAAAGSWSHLRVVVLTAVGAGTAPPVSGVTRTWAHRLIRQATPGQTLVTSGAAVRAASWLLPGLDLAYRGSWRPAASESADRIYELVDVDPRAGTRTGGSNLGWARAILHGRDEHPAHRTVVEGTLRTWRSGDLAGTVTILGGASAAILGCAAELASTAHAGGSTILHGTWTEDHADRYGVYREAFGTYAARCDDRQLVADLEGHAHELARLLPEVGAAVGGAHLALGGHPDLARLCDCLETWLTKMAQRTPVLLVLDHAELMTAASELVLTQLAHSLSGTPVRFLLADHGDVVPSRRVLRLMEHLGEGLRTQLTVAA